MLGVELLVLNVFRFGLSRVVVTSCLGIVSSLFPLCLFELVVAYCHFEGLFVISKACDDIFQTSFSYSVFVRVFRCVCLGSVVLHWKGLQCGSMLAI